MRYCFLLLLFGPSLIGTPFNWKYFYECGTPGVECGPPTPHNFGTTDYRYIQPITGDTYFDNQWQYNIIPASNHANQAVGFGFYGTGFGTIYGVGGKTYLPYLGPDSFMPQGGDINERGEWFVDHGTVATDAGAYLVFGIDENVIFKGDYYSWMTGYMINPKFIDSAGNEIEIMILGAYTINEFDDLRVQVRIIDDAWHPLIGRVADGILSSRSSLAMPEPHSALLLAVPLAGFWLAALLKRKRSTRS